jgi:hypothetical protein
MDWLTGASRGDVKEATMQVVDELRKINKTLERGITHNPQPRVAGGWRICAGRWWNTSTGSATRIRKSG